MLEAAAQNKSALEAPIYFPDIQRLADQIREKNVKEYILAY